MANPDVGGTTDATVMAARRVCAGLCWFGVVALALGAAPGWAQAPTQSGGIVNGQRLQPRPGDVSPAERRAGVAPAGGEADRNAGAVEDLNKELLGKEQERPPSQPSVPPIQSGSASGTSR